MARAQRGHGAALGCWVPAAAVLGWVWDSGASSLLGHVWHLAASVSSKDERRASSLKQEGPLTWRVFPGEHISAMVMPNCCSST